MTTIYEVRYHDPNEGACLEWRATKKEALARSRELRKEGYRPSLTSCTIDPGRAGLVHWLNDHVKRDNG